MVTDVGLPDEARKIRKAIQEQVRPADGWATYSVRVLGHYETYSDANSRVRRAEETSDLQTDAELGRGHRRVKKKRFEDEDDSAHTDSSADTLVIPSTSQVPKPPTVRGFPALQRSNAFCRSPNEKLNSSDQTDAILLAVAKCETRVEDQSRLLEQVMTLQKDILHQLQHTRPVSSTHDHEYNFAPVDTLVAFAALEEKITSDKDFKELLVRRLEVLGGSSLKIAVKSVMDTILTNSLQQKFNWEGKTCWRTKENFTKKGFKSTKVCQLVFSALLRKPQLSTDENVIGASIMKYLRSSSDRCGGRAHRSRKQADDSSHSVTSAESG
ncbi:hypothetical protein Pcinc_037810 [Petrolisthes cinctipes]|uniref:DUF4806 domain-containing protein n=1 Tax=Petrolisthes cinctipes TaxID=88211 RepID=A0AAE1BV14_PETCI|nr:hypothetical protein Pcinc_037810 [Petrolisthes cinctipes]